MSQQSNAGIALRECHVPTYNARTTIHQDADWHEFKQSILENGVIQPILLRPVQGKKTAYEVVAGQRRFIASLELFGIDFEIPALVKVMSDQQAELATTIENVHRANMSPAEEAEGAAKVLARCDGDRNEAAKRLGWSRSNLDNRLKLMACSDRVRKALAERKIALGLGELMAGMTHAKQDELLAGYFANGVPSVEEARKQVMALTKSLPAAIFDKTDCGACPNNSARQASMFGNIEEGHCLNSTCYDEKTDIHLDGIVAAMKDEYQVIRIVRPSDKYTLSKLNAQDVGDDQATACRNCNNFGAAVSAMPNSLGSVMGSLCFDTNCHGQMVQANKDAIALAKKDEETALAAAQAGQNHAQQETPSSAPEGVGNASDTPPTGKNAGANDVKKDKPEKASPTVTLTSGILEFRTKLYKKVIFAEFATNPLFNAQLVLALILSNRTSHFKSDELAAGLAKKGLLKSDKAIHGLPEAMKQIKDIEPDKARGILPNLGAIATNTMSLEELTGLAKLSGADMAKYFCLNDESGKQFLNTLTKNQIVAICEEVGISQKMGKTFQSISTGKKDEFIKQITGIEGFEYQGKVPNVIKPAFAK